MSGTSVSKPAGGFPGLLRVVALIAVVGGGRGLARVHASGRSQHSPPPACGVRVLGAVPVRCPRMGPQGLKALVGPDSSDARLRDARDHAGLACHLRGPDCAARGVAARFRVRCRATGILGGHGDRRWDRLVDLAASRSPIAGHGTAFPHRGPRPIARRTTCVRGSFSKSMECEKVRLPETERHSSGRISWSIDCSSSPICP